MPVSDVKVGKKTPLTLKHFEDFAAKLATREDSERSWTVDLSARRAKAQADAQPFRDTARAKSQEAERIKDRLGELKKARPRDEAAIADADTRVAGLLKEAREATNKAESIENAVYDLKAVNPHRKAEVDQRTPAELLHLVETKGREVAEALAALRVLTNLRLLDPDIIYSLRALEPMFVEDLDRETCPARHCESAEPCRERSCRHSRVRSI